MTKKKISLKAIICKECGMSVDVTETYHPYAACLMFKACHDGNVVQANLDAVVAHGLQNLKRRSSTQALGLDSLHAAERAAKSLPPVVDLPMESPTFDSDGDPTDETLTAIKCWQTNFELEGDPWAKFIKFCREAWNMDYGTISEEQDEDGKTLLCFVTGGWSANEAVQGAMNSNFMFHAMRWHASYRGGLVKYVIG